MLTKKTPLIILSSFLCLWAVESPAQLALAGSSIIYSTSESPGNADTSSVFTIQEIQIEGARQTRDKVILRELPFTTGNQYALSDLITRFGKARQQLLNTGLFQNVTVSLLTAENEKASVLVTVKERWYIFPVPIADLVDGSVQQWMRTMDLNRVNYGMRLKHKNISGLNDRLYIDMVNGYTKGLRLRYEGLPLDHRLTWFGNFSVSAGRTRNLVYATQNNKLVSYNHNDRFVYSYFNTQASVNYRPAIKNTHTLGIGYNRERFTDTVSKMNADFINGGNQLAYPELFYQLHHRNVDFLPYPTKGKEGLLLFQRKGLGGPVDLWQLTARTSAYWPVSKKAFLNLRLTGMLKLPFDQPYRQQSFLGNNGLYLQGYEDHIVDGVAGGFAKTSLHRQLLDKHLRIRSNRFQCINDIPVKAYIKGFGNAGYAYHPSPGDSRFNNRLLYSGGLGLDIVLFYDVTFRFEYSINHLGQNGLYLHDRMAL